MAITLATDTYITLADARAYADLNVLSLPDDDTDCENLLKRAAMQLDRKYGNQYMGYKQASEQALAWPRYVYDENVRRYQDAMFIADADGNPRNFQANNGVPKELGQAQVELAVMLSAGFEPLAQPASAVTETLDKVDVIESRRFYKTAHVADDWYSIRLILRPILMASTSPLQATRGA